MASTASSESKLQLVPSSTIDSRGAGKAIELGPAAGNPLMVVLRLEEIIEQESLHVSVWGSGDGSNWGQKPLFLFPQLFYRGVTPAALDLTQRPEVKFLQARWEVNRWGRGYPRPHFSFSVSVEPLKA